MKSAAAAFLSVVLAVAMGYGAFFALGVGPNYSRNPLPIVIFAALFLVVTGFVYARWFFASMKSCVAGLAAYAALIAALVAYFGGTALAGFFADWFVSIIAVTLAPWLVGFAAGKFAQRIRLT